MKTKTKEKTKKQNEIVDSPALASLEWNKVEEGDEGVTREREREGEGGRNGKFRGARGEKEEETPASEPQSPQK